MEENTILFVDDDVMIRKAFGRILRRQEFAVEFAENGEEAIQLAMQKQYAVVATDYTMPGPNGFDVVGALRLSQPNASFVLVSANCDLDLTLDAINEHSLDFVIPKPWSVLELTSTLNRAIELYWERMTAQRLLDSMHGTMDRKTV